MCAFPVCLFPVAVWLLHVRGLKMNSSFFLLLLFYIFVAIYDVDLIICCCWVSALESVYILQCSFVNGCAWCVMSSGDFHSRGCWVVLW